MIIFVVLLPKISKSKIGTVEFKITGYPGYGTPLFTQGPEAFDRLEVAEIQILGELESLFCYCHNV